MRAVATISGVTFPSLKGDGSIEAWWKGLECPPHVWKFPSLKGDGSIEAIQGRCGLRRRSAFPSLKGDGSIEACVMWSVMACRLSSFPSLKGDGSIEACR